MAPTMIEAGCPPATATPSPANAALATIQYPSVSSIPERSPLYHIHPKIPISMAGIIPTTNFGHLAGFGILSRSKITCSESFFRVVSHSLFIPFR